jgi:tetratricopeptide (TPR) repeat protein
MVSTKSNEKTLPEIEMKLNQFGGDMIRIEYLENCLKQILPNDAKRFCHLKLAEAYANRLMWGLAAKNMDGAADCATTYKDKIDFYLKEIAYLIKIGDYLLIDKAAKKALLCGNNAERENIKSYIKRVLAVQAQEYEKKMKRSNAAQIYEKLIEMPITTAEEKKQYMQKVAELNSKLGRLKDAMRYEQMLKRPIEVKRDPETDVRRISFEDLGIERV